MINWISKKIIGSKNQRDIKRMQPIVQKINEIEEKLQSEPEEALRERTAKWKEQLAAMEDPEEQQRFLEEILPEAFAVVKNGARRLCGREVMVCDQPVTWNMSTSTCSSSAASCCTAAKSPRWLPVKVRRSSRPFPSTSTPSPARALTS